VLAAAAAHTPDALALAVAHQSLRFSFAEMDRESNGSPGAWSRAASRAASASAFGAELRRVVLTMFAAARAGLVLVNINPAYRTRELEFALRWVGCRALIFAPRFKSSDYAGMLQSLIPELKAAAPGASSAPHSPNFASWCSSAPRRPPEPCPSRIFRPPATI